MIIEVSEYYKNKGYIRAYLATNKEPRRVCMLRNVDGTTKSMSYAKYLYTSHYNCDVAEGDQVDHINRDKMDDRIENLQKLYPLIDKATRDRNCKSYENFLLYKFGQIIFTHNSDNDKKSSNKIDYKIV